MWEKVVKVVQNVPYHSLKISHFVHLKLSTSMRKGRKSGMLIDHQKTRVRMKGGIKAVENKEKWQKMLNEKQPIGCLD